MPLLIPLRSDLPFFDFQATLDGATYTLEFRWNTREKSWYLNILTDEGVPIIMSIKFLIDHPLGCRSVNPLKPPGVFLAEDTSGARVDAGFNEETGIGDLGDRIILLYFESSELPIDRSAV